MDESARVRGLITNSGIQAAAESTVASQASILRSSRAANTPESHAVAKLIKRGKVELQFLPTDPLKRGAAGAFRFQRNRDLFRCFEFGKESGWCHRSRDEALAKKAYSVNLSPRSWVRGVSIPTIGGLFESHG